MKKAETISTRTVRQVSIASELVGKEEKIVEQICASITRIKGWTREELLMDESFSSLGLKSLDLVALIADLSTYLEKKLPATLAFDHITIARLAHYLTQSSVGEGQATKKQSPELSVTPGLSFSPINDTYRGDDIAVVGMACKFPGEANTPEAFWNNLVQKRDAITEVPKVRWDVDSFFTTTPNVPGTVTTKRGGFIDNVSAFDAEFFNISPREASLIDPQHRLVLELSWEAIEHAGINPESLRESDSGVFVGISGSEYGQPLFNSPTHLSLYADTGAAPSISATVFRVFWDLMAQAWL